MKNKDLIALFMRMIEVSGQATVRRFNAVKEDPTDGEDLTVYAYVDHGFYPPKTAGDYAEYCLKEAFGEFEPIPASPCTHCAYEQHEVFRACEAVHGGFFNPKEHEEFYPAPQLLEIKVQSIWGTDITINDFRTGDLVMKCYFDQEWIPRKTPNKPRATLERLIWDARWMDKKEAQRVHEQWDEEPFEDPFGCAADYE